MQSRPTKFTIKMGGKVHEITPSTIRSPQEPTTQKDENALEGHTIQKDINALEGPTVPSNNDQNTLDVSSSDYTSEEDENNNKNKNKNNCNNKNSQTQMVLYDPSLNNTKDIEPIENNNNFKPRTITRSVKAVPEVGAFTVQCANCFKWRLIPDQEKYEVIREHITEQPFLCATTRQWDREVSCDDPTDIEQDGTRIWAIDKPNIAQPPPGWKRILRLRSEGSSKFADVYYTSPDGTKFRSVPDVQKYMKNHPEIAQAIDINRFSFQIPKPLSENYVRKRSTPMPAPGTPEYLEPSPVEPIAWAGPRENLDLQIAEPLSWAGPAENRNGVPPYMKTPDNDHVNRPAKKAKRYDVDCL